LGRKRSPPFKGLLFQNWPKETEENHGKSISRESGKPAENQT